jgi:D-alanyl-D-alanine carboxypeptidase (penicillin-binding protein 5/6)
MGKTVWELDGGVKMSDRLRGEITRLRVCCSSGSPVVGWSERGAGHLWAGAPALRTRGSNGRDEVGGDGMKHIAFVLVMLASIGCAGCEEAASSTTGPRVENIARDPYVGAIAVDAGSGLVLFDDNAGAEVYPASTVKLMDLLIILEKVECNELSFSDTVTVGAEAAAMGGSQVYLGKGERFTVDDLLYAMTVESANDAAVALAVHVAGSKEAFVEQMNRRAAEIGMKSTRFASPHGLPPAKGDSPDISTAYDLSLLAREVLKHPEALRYTGCRGKIFRPDTRPLPMHNHNHLLGAVEGCDGLKTGYFRAAGFSVVATALRDGRRLIAVVAGSRDSKTRDRTAQRLLTEVSLPAKGRGDRAGKRAQDVAGSRSES